MKKLLSLLLTLAMMVTALPMAVSAEEATETPAYTAGDLVWSYDFENDNGSLLDNAPKGFIFGKEAGSSNLVADVEENAENKYLHFSVDNASTTASHAQTMTISVPDAAKDENGFFTFEVDLKLEKYNADTMTGGGKNSEYNIGLYGTKGSLLGRSNFTFSPTNATANSSGNLAINGTRTPSSVSHKSWANTNVEGHIFLPYAWNNYRFVVRKTDSNQYYADLYLNGWLTYTVGQRFQTSDFSEFKLEVVLPAAVKHGGIYIDNPKVYYGVTEAEQTIVAKGAFHLDNFDFNDLPATTYNATDGTTTYEANMPIIQGSNVDHVIGKLNRYAGWNMTLDIQKGKYGKAASDSSLAVSGNGRIQISNPFPLQLITKVTILRRYLPQHLPHRSFTLHILLLIITKFL